MMKSEQTLDFAASLIFEVRPAGCDCKGKAKVFSLLRID